MSQFRSIVESILREAKQVGILYHATTLKGLKGILKFDKIQADYYNSGCSDGISTSRDKTYFYQAPVQLILDGNKLSNKYKLEPYTAFDDLPEYWRSESETVIKVKPSDNEDEYAFTLPEIHKYIKGIMILPNLFISKNLTQQLYDILKNYNYPIYTPRGQQLNIEDFNKYHNEMSKTDKPLYRQREIASGLDDYNKLKADEIYNAQEKQIDKAIEKDTGMFIDELWKTDSDKLTELRNKYKNKLYTNIQGNLWKKF